MTLLFFDIHTGSSVTIDDQGVDVPNANVARRMALETLGQTIMDEAARGTADVTKVELRDQYGPLLRVSASVVVEELCVTAMTTPIPK
ncbi:DUF6894 family protein [Bradyrhizobium sp. McL0616]|uniref:DUF6894 family protein n=1 Tax=Bradyrhizobium sp. McL0616 TaxID=3415674 RepID=UPI003CF6F610